MPGRNLASLFPSPEALNPTGPVVVAIKSRTNVVSDMTLNKRGRCRDSPGMKSKALDTTHVTHEASVEVWLRNSLSQHELSLAYQQDPHPILNFYLSPVTGRSTRTCKTKRLSAVNLFLPPPLHHQPPLGPLMPCGPAWAIPPIPMFKLNVASHNRVQDGHPVAFEPQRGRSKKVSAQQAARGKTPSHSHTPPPLFPLHPSPAATR